MEKLTGETMGYLFIEKDLGKEVKNGKVRRYYKCICKCGNVVKRERWTLLGNNSKVKSCGCYKKEFLSKERKTHGMSETRFYNIYLGMKNRVFNTNYKKYKQYGGRGIKVCERWLDFKNFKKDMHESYLEHVKKHGEENTTIERKEIDGDYCPDNCIWATKTEQNHNRSFNKKTFKATNINTGETYFHNVKSEFARMVGISDKHIGSVLNGNRKICQGFKFEYVE